MHSFERTPLTDGEWMELFNKQLERIKQQQAVKVTGVLIVELLFLLRVAIVALL